MVSKEQLQSVAKRCPEFNSLESINPKFSISCEVCVHFTKNHECNLDLIDEILIYDVGEFL